MQKLQKVLLVFFISFVACCAVQAQNVSLLFPEKPNWNVVKENEVLEFQVRLSSGEKAHYNIEGDQNLNMKLDSLGHFHWQPAYDLVDRINKSADFFVIFQATDGEGNRIRHPITFTVEHVNRPPVVEEMPLFYVRQSTQNTYQIPGEYAYDPDGDPIVIKSIPSQMPEGANLSSLGQFSWAPSRSQFYSLRNDPLTVEFIVQDQPDKAETTGRLKISQTQQDLPPEILVLPGDSLFSIKEDATLNLKLYLSDPNGDDNIRSAGFVASDTRVPESSLKENTSVQYEFTWVPGYDFVQEVQKSLQVEVTFFTLDRSNNRAQKKVRIQVMDAENVVEKDAHQYTKYRNTLVAATQLLQQLDARQKELNKDYKKARKGKKNRSILNASLGAATGLSPVALDTETSKIVSGVGGTTVLTMGTLEATEVIGRSKESIMEKIKIGIELRNKIQSQGDEFARKYALKSSRRTGDFEKDIDKFRAAMNDQRLVLMEMDAHVGSGGRMENKTIKQAFIDFSEL